MQNVVSISIGHINNTYTVIVVHTNNTALKCLVLALPALCNTGASHYVKFAVSRTVGYQRGIKGKKHDEQTSWGHLGLLLVAQLVALVIATRHEVRGVHDDAQAREDLPRENPGQHKIIPAKTRYELAIYQ
jgi:hypothetical protein